MSLKKNVVGLLGASTIVIGAVGGLMIQNAEGKRNAAYLDPVNIWTICYGHTGPEVVKGLVWSDAKCEEVFLVDVAKHQTPIQGPKNCIKSAPLTLNQRDAVTSFIFNVGNAKFCSSTMAKKLSVRDYRGAAAEFPKWKYAGGKELRGLAIRRKAEQDLFNSLVPWVPYTTKSNGLRTTVVYK